MPDPTIAVTKDGERNICYATFSVLTRIGQINKDGFENDPDHIPVSIEYVPPEHDVMNPETTLRWLEGRRLGDGRDPVS